jgi:hypothetical protein
MQDSSPEKRSPALSILEHTIWIGGGAFGGCLALFWTTVWASGDVFLILNPGGYFCGATVGALLGWTPGFAARILTEDLAHSRWIGLVAAAAVGAIFTAVITTALTSGASC